MSAMTMSTLYALVALFLTVALQGCGDGATYSSMEDALTKICQGSSCEASCRCCVSTIYPEGEACAADIAKGLTPQESEGCKSCISSYTEGWEPAQCFTERNMGYCGYQYWTNARGECRKFNATCGEGYLEET
mmetsp:Transcript_14247/g.24414  ORF Transcript_14247/g.24414 Transcript_14247/m.24414 type:complete len:133 (-) Transcript_14247:192-590(-)